jgi:hypothetical protein
METTLPQQLMQQCLHTLKHLRNQPFQLNQQTYTQINNPEDAQALRLRLEPIPLKPVPCESIVAAVDTSTTKIGETRQGIIIAIRGTNIWKQNTNYRYTRLGPFIFHVTEENKKELYNTLERAYFAPPRTDIHQFTPSLSQMPMRIATLLERWLQTTLTRTVSEGLILFDGSLTSGTPDTPTMRMRETLANARKRGSIVLAFSKMTNLRVNGYLITDLLPNNKPPYLLETVDLKLRPPMVLLGEVYVARLTKGNLAFRLDVDREIPASSRIEAVERLLANDLFQQSYPETLRLAHILCTFTANEVLAMQHFVTRNCGLQIIDRPDMHRLLFGPFGRGECYS